MADAVYKYYRKQAGLAVERASEELNVSPRTLQRYESGESSPPPEIVLNMARVYRAPALIRSYCATVCPVGQETEPPLLNNTDSSPLARFVKYAEELDEAVPAARKLAKMIINKKSARDFSGQELAELEWLAEQALTDVAQALDEAWEAYAACFGMEAREKAVKRHREKMREKGYIKKKPVPPGVTEQPVLYSVRANNSIFYYLDHSPS